MGKTGNDTGSTRANDKTIKGSKNRFKGKNNGPKWKKLKQETGKLKIGTKGLLITNSIVGKYKEAMQEILYILRQHAEVEDFHKENPTSNPIGHQEMDPEKLLEQELSQVNQEFDRFVPGSCISKGLNFVVFKNEEDVPSKYVEGIFTQILKNKAYSARFLSKIVPIDGICNANVDELKKLLESILKSQFPLLSFSADSNGQVCDDKSHTNGSEVNSGHDTSCNSHDASAESHNDINDEKLEATLPGTDTWALYYKNTNSNALNRDDVLNLVTQMLSGKYKVNLKVPDKLIVVCVIKAESLNIPESGEWIPDPESDWYTHQSEEWMYNSAENVFFHIESKTIVPSGSTDPLGLKHTDNFPNFEDTADVGYVDQEEGADHEGDYTGQELEYAEEEGGEEEDLSIDFNKDLMAGTASSKGQLESKLENEDRYITRECLSIQYVSNSEALCYFSGVFDGHQGPACSEYIVKHLKNNILTVFRQNVASNSFKKRKLMPNSAFKFNQFPNNSDPDPSNEQQNKNEVDWEIYNLLYAIKKGVEMLDYNYCSYCINSHASHSTASQESIDPANIFNLNGSTLNLVFLMGPDDAGGLKLISANVGDSRAILCIKMGEKYVAKDLTLDHKPNLRKERERIIKGGGSVEHLQNTWRALMRVDQKVISDLANTVKGVNKAALNVLSGRLRAVSNANKPSNPIASFGFKPGFSRSDKSGVLCGLSTSRSIGDYILKGNIISGEVDLFVFDVDFDDFMFVVQCTDGITDRLSSQEIVNSILGSIEAGLSPSNAADKVVKMAEARKSFDDKTCNIIYFTWHKEFYRKVLDPDQPEMAREESQQPADDQEDEDIFM